MRKIALVICLLLQPLAIADEIAEVADPIYAQSEANGIADGLCRAIKFINMMVVPIAAVMFTVLGFTALQGKLTWTILVTFAIGLIGMRSFGTILEFMMPKIGLQFGCDCATYKLIKDINGVQRSVSTGLNKDCTPVEVVD
jgi:hypothetical protein